MIKTVIFDIGNVLFHFSHQKMVQQLAQRLETPFSTLQKKLIEERLIHVYEAGELTTDQLIENLLTLSSVQPSREVLISALCEIFQENEAIFPLVQSLKRQGKRLLLLSNTNEAHFHYIQRHFSSTQLFDDAVLSYKVKSSKPEAMIYQKALELAGCSPHECFYIDDVLGHVEAARQMGIDAEVYQSVETLRVDLARRMLFT